MRNVDYSTVPFHHEAHNGVSFYVYSTPRHGDWSVRIGGHTVSKGHLTRDEAENAARRLIETTVKGA